MSHTVTLLQWGLISWLPFVWPLAVAGEVLFLPPTPYLSVKDSPFDMSGLGTTFFFEDFEDGLIFGSPAPPSVYLNTPGAMTDSVDADDGAIDGFGNKGHSLMTNLHSMTFSNPPRWSSYFAFEFHESGGGFLPTVFGFAWTDGMENARLVVMVTERDDRRTSTTFSPLMDSSYAGESAEDRFIGAVSSIGIKRIEVIHRIETNFFSNEFEIDHLQFGLSVCEPVSSLMSGGFLAVMMGFHLLRRVNSSKGGNGYERNSIQNPR